MPVTCFWKELLEYMRAAAGLRSKAPAAASDPEKILK
jgi:hypothetical protein